MSDEDRKKWEEDHARSHNGQDWMCEPIAPYDDVCSDLLAHVLYLNVHKKALDSTCRCRSRRNSIRDGCWG